MYRGLFFCGAQGVLRAAGAGHAARFYSACAAPLPHTHSGEASMKRFLFLFAAAALVCPLVLVLFAGCAGEGERTLYTIDAAYEEGVLTAEMTVSYYNDTGGSRDELWFNLYGNAYREGAAHAPVRQVSPRPPTMRAQAAAAWRSAPSRPVQAGRWAARTRTCCASPSPRPSPRAGGANLRWRTRSRSQRSTTARA